MKPPTLNRMYLFEALPVILPQTRANYPRGAGLFAVSNFPRLRVGQESRDFPSRGSAWDKNRAAKPCRHSGETRIVPRNLAAIRERQESRRETFPPPGRDKNRAAKPCRHSGETRIAPRNLPAARERQETCRETFPPSGLGQETVFLACRRVVWVRKQCF